MNYSIGTEDKKIKWPQVNGMIIVGQQDGLTLGVTNRYTRVINNYIKREIMVVALNDNMNTVRSIEIPDTKDRYAQTATFYEGKIYILTSRKEKGNVYYERIAVDPATMQQIGEIKSIYTYTSERKDDSYQWIEQSPNGTLSALVHITTNRKSDKFEAVEIMLDEEMNIEWRRDYPIYSLTNMMVTDDGEIITLGSGKAGVYISVLNESNSIDIQEKTSVTVTNTKLIGYKDGKILGIGIGVNRDDKNDIQYFGISADVKKQEINIGYQSLTDADKNVFRNNDIGRKAYTPGFETLDLLHCQPTDFGGVATIQCRWAVETCNQNGGCSITSYISGILIFGVDQNGDIVWHHAIRSAQKQNGLFSHLTNALCVEGNDVYFLTAESPKWPTHYTIEKKVKFKKMNNGTKSLAVYHINANGAITKNVEKMKKALVINDNTKKFGDTHIGFIIYSSGIAMIKMKF